MPYMAYMYSTLVFVTSSGALCGTLCCTHQISLTSLHNVCVCVCM